MRALGVEVRSLASAIAARAAFRRRDVSRSDRESAEELLAIA